MTQPSPADTSFADSVAATRCPYAGLAVWRQQDVDSRLVDEHGVAVLETVGRQVRDRIVSDVAAGVDMLAIQVCHPSVVGELDDFTRAAALFIRGLLGADALPGESGESAEQAVDESEWLAYVHGERLFVFTLCPFYDERHPRRSGTGSAFIVIQFLNSFHKINMHRMSLAEKKRLSDRVNAVFSAAGMDYFGYITKDTYDALKTVKPLHQGDRPVRWWQAL